MMPKLSSFLVLQCLFISLANGRNISEVTEVITSILNLINNSRSIDIKTCWLVDKQLELVKALNKKYILAKVEKQQKIFYDKSHRNWLLIDANCEEELELLTKLSTDEFSKLNIIAFINDTNLQTLQFSFNSEFFYLLENRSRIKVKQAYRPSNGSSLVIENFGTWHKDQRIFIDHRKFKITSIRRRNFNLLQLNASLVTTNQDSQFNLDNYRDTHIDTITKLNYKLTNLVIEWLNASVGYTFVDTWGYKNNKTMEWNGMIGELINNKADIGASPLFLTSDRIDVIDYLICTSQTRSKFVFRSPKLSFTENVFVLPFHEDVWICLIISPFIAALFLYFSLFTEWKSNIGIIKPSLNDSFFTLYCAITQQGIVQVPKAYGSRLIMYISFTAFMFLYASYSANIVALLQSPSNKIQTLTDLLNSRLEFGVDDTVFNHFYFKHADENVRRKIYLNKIRRKDGGENFYNMSEGIGRVRDGHFAFHMEVGVGYKFVSEIFQEDEKCGLQEIQYLQVIDPFYSVRKKSPYKEHFKIGLLRLLENGLQVRENARFYTKKPKCHSGNSNFVSVGMIDTRPAFLIFGYGLCCAILLMLIERAYYRYFGEISFKKCVKKGR